MAYLDLPTNLFAPPGLYRAYTLSPGIITKLFEGSSFLGLASLRTKLLLSIALILARQTPEVSLD